MNSLQKCKFNFSVAQNVSELTTGGLLVGNRVNLVSILNQLSWMGQTRKNIYHKKPRVGPPCLLIGTNGRIRNCTSLRILVNAGQTANWSSSKQHRRMGVATHVLVISNLGSYMVHSTERPGYSIQRDYASSGIDDYTKNEKRQNEHWKTNPSTITHKKVM